MGGTPMVVAIALSLLIAQLNDEPWNNMICTFSVKPEFHVIQGNTLEQKIQDIQGM